MKNNYSVVFTSLNGLLNHESLAYEGIRRPAEVMRVLDRPSGKDRELSSGDLKALEEYFHDLYGVFMKKLSHFVVEATVQPNDPVKLLAMLQEIVKVKKMIAK